MQNRPYNLWLLLIILAISVLGCRQAETPEQTPIAEPTATVTVSFPEVADATAGLDFITVATDAPSRFQDFEDIDPFGNVIGFDPEVMANIASILSLDYEFVVTGYNGLLDSVVNGEFNAAMSALLIPEQPSAGLAYTMPYLEVGQVLVVRANETELQSYRDLILGIPIGVKQFSSGEQTARTVLNLIEPDLQIYQSTPEALQALIDRSVEGVIIDSPDAEHYTALYPQQLKIAGGPEREAWITAKAYGIAVPESDANLLNRLNEAIAQLHEDGTIERITQERLVAQAPINAGESLVGTLPDELVIGLVGQPESLDPAAREPTLIDWEIKRNTMSGLYMIDSGNNLIPLLAEGPPQVSEDKLEYTIRIRTGLTFPDGSELTADDVRFSIRRAAGLGNFQVNRYLKDADEDSFADIDSVQVLDPQTIKFILKQPTAYFPSVLATPPFFVVNETCYNANADPVNNCDSIGSYTVENWEPNVQMRLVANPQWPGLAPAFGKIQLRFYADESLMRRSLENGAIDLAWIGLSKAAVSELQTDPAYEYWQSPPTFKSYLVFEQSESPWSNARLREAIALTIDRESLAEGVFQGTRSPLYSPVPDQTPGQVQTEPRRDLETARAILLAAGYSPGRKLELTIWYVNDGRYTALEEAYAGALKAQLEETELIAVTLEGAPWQVFRPASINCDYPAFLLGWPSIEQPAAYLDAMSWLEYFITNTDSICSNYDSPAMTELYEQAMAEVDQTQRLELYRQIQELWAREFPTLDLTQEARGAISQAKVQNVVIDAMGLMHYDVLTKIGE